MGMNKLETFAIAVIESIGVGQRQVAVGVFGMEGG